MPGQFANSPNIIGRPYKDIADYPNDPPIACSPDGRQVYKGIRKVYMVFNGTIIDFYDWDVYGNQWRFVQQKAQRAWGIKWTIG